MASAINKNSAAIKEPGTGGVKAFNWLVKVAEKKGALVSLEVKTGEKWRTVKS